MANIAGVDFGQGTETLSAASRRELATECDRIEQAVSKARTELIMRLMGATQKVNADSRVVDIEKALDNVELHLKQSRAALGRN